VKRLAISTGGLAALLLLLTLAAPSYAAHDPAAKAPPCPVNGAGCPCGCASDRECKCQGTATIVVNPTGWNVTFTTVAGTFTSYPSGTAARWVVTPAFSGSAHYTVTAEAYGSSFSRTVDVRPGCMTEITVDGQKRTITATVRAKLPAAEPAPQPVYVAQPVYPAAISFGGFGNCPTCRGR
jgi:uncharacterized membrane protein